MPDGGVQLPPDTNVRAYALLTVHDASIEELPNNF